MLAPLGYWVTLAAVNGRRRPGEPPLVRGSLPYVGVAVRFGRNATAYVQHCQATYGDVFTLFIAGQRMTFMLDPLAIPAVLRSKQLAFFPVSDSILAEAFNLDGIRLRMDLHAAELLGRTQLRGEALSNITHGMGARLEDLVPGAVSNTWEGVPLYAKIWDIMFEAGTDALFGSGLVTSKLRADFETFDLQFPQMAAGLPRALVKEGESALDRLGHTHLLGDGPSGWIAHREVLLSDLEDDEAGRARVPILWAIHANTIPATFWSLYYLLRHPEALRAIQRELDERWPTPRRALDIDRLGELRLLDSAISEALSLSSGSLTIRQALEPMTLETPTGPHSLRRGDRVCLAPFITHRDPDIFEAPLEYRFDRFYSPSGRKQFYKHGERVPLPLMPFGASVSMCPGRFFAMNEIKLFIARVLASWEIEAPTCPIPDFDLSRAGLGIYPPAHDVRVRVRRKV